MSTSFSPPLAGSSRNVSWNMMHECVVCFNMLAMQFYCSFLLCNIIIPISHYIMYYCRQFRHPVWCSSAKVPILLLLAMMPEWCMGKRERSRVPVTWTSFTLGHSLGLGQSVRSQPCMQLEDGWDHSRMLTHSINTLTVKVPHQSDQT